LGNLKDIGLTLVYFATCGGISLVFWFTNSKVKLAERMLISAHGISTSLLLSVAFLMSYFGLSSFDYIEAYSAFFILPIISMLFSIFRHQGKKDILLLHLIMLPLLIFSWFFGGLYVTGDSL
jgi:hypothetical protein